MKPPQASKLEKPKFTVDESSGRRIYEGSLSQTTTELSEERKARMLKEMKSAPRMPSELVMALGMSPYDPFCAESIRRHLAELEKGGHVAQVKDARGKLLGWQIPEEKKA